MSSQCTAAVGKPVCEATKCRSCKADSECPGGPRVCMWHDDGRCATAAETVTVVDTDLQGAVANALAQNKALVLVPGLADEVVYSGNRKLAIVGKGAATINGGNKPGIHVTGGELFVRDLVVEGSRPGVRATGGKVVLESLRIRGNPGGGILIDNAGFEILNCDIRENGPGDLGGDVYFGGIRTQNLPIGQTKRIERVSLISNKAAGFSCTTAVEGSGIFVSGNAVLDISNTCAVTACQVAGPTCGATLP